MTTFKDMLKESFLESFDGDAITFEVILLSLAVTVLLSLYLFLIYQLLGRKTFYNANFNLSLVGMTVATAAIVLAIQSNLVLSLGMVGALSIVRYRSAVKDSLDLFFLFWGVATGIICGARQYGLAIVVSLLLTVLLFVLSHIPVMRAPYVLVVNAAKEDMGVIRDTVQEYCKYYNIKSCHLAEDRLRMIVEIRTKRQDELLLQLGTMDGVAVSVLTYEGDIAA